MDGERDPTLTDAEVSDLVHVRDSCAPGCQRIGPDYCVVRVDSLRVVVAALDRLVRRDDLMRKQLAAEQAKNRRRR